MTYLQILQKGEQNKLNPADERSVRSESEAKRIETKLPNYNPKRERKKFQVPKIREQKENIKANIIRIQKINREYF